MKDAFESARRRLRVKREKCAASHEVGRAVNDV